MAWGSGLLVTSSCVSDILSALLSPEIKGCLIQSGLGLSPASAGMGKIRHLVLTIPRGYCGVPVFIKSHVLVFRLLVTSEDFSGLWDTACCSRASPAPPSPHMLSLSGHGCCTCHLLPAFCWRFSSMPAPSCLHCPGGSCLPP